MEIYDESSGSTPAATSSISGKKILLFSIIPLSSLVILFSIFTLFSRYKAPEEIKGVSAVKPRSIYENPFDKRVQYINPFASYKNPFNDVE